MILKSLSEITKQNREKGNPGSVPYIEIGDINIDTKEYSHKDKPSLVGCLMARKGNILISRVRPTRGAISLVKEDKICVSSAFTVLESDENVLFNKYLFYTLAYNKNFYNYLRKMQKGTSYPSCKETDILNFQINFPPLIRQKQIVGTLEKSDILRKNRQDANEISNSIIQSVFLQMFGDPIENIKGYVVCELKDCTQPLGGFAFRSKDFVETGIPLIRIGNVNKGYFDTSNLVYLPESFLNEYKKYVITSKDVLISLTGTTGKDDYGNACFVSASFKQWFLNQRVAKLEIDEKRLVREYIFSFLRYPAIKAHLLKRGKGIRQANLSNKDILSLKISLPPLSEQQKFADLVQKVEKIKEKQQESKKDMDNLFNSLMQKAFLGA